LPQRAAGSRGGRLGLDARGARPDRAVVPGGWSSFGTDGFGLSDTRGVLRRHFKVDAPSVVLRVLEPLTGLGEVDATAPARASAAYRLKDVVAAPAGTSEGASE
jgi:pyruvate dehydrogenase E1 component